MDGRKAAIIDADEQGTVTAWGQRRQHSAPTVYPLNGRSMADAIGTMEGRGAGLITIDTPPHARPIINMAATNATGCIIVTGPYPEDLEAVGTVARIVHTLKKPA
jgi:chromosome partitioning protein